jgi:uncharacterized membrane protein
LLVMAVLAGFVATALPAGAGTPVNAEMWLLYFLLLAAGIGWLAAKSEGLPAGLRRPLLIILATLPFLTPTAVGPKPSHPIIAIVYILLVYVGFLFLQRRIGREIPGLISAATVAALLAGTLAATPDHSSWWYVATCGVLCLLAVSCTARRARDPSYVVVLLGGPLGLYHLLNIPDVPLAVEWLFPVGMILLVIASGLARLRPAPSDVPLILLGASLFGGYLWGSLEWHELAAFHGALMLALAALHAASAWLAARLRPGEPLLRLVLAGVGVGFLTLFFPAQFDTATVTVAWAVEAAVLAFVGLRLQQRVIWRGSWVLLAMGTMRYILFDCGSLDGLEGATPFLSQHTVGALSLVVAGLLMATRQAREFRFPAISAADREQLVGAGFAFLVANGVLLLAMTLEIDLFFDRRATPASPGGAAVGLPETKQFVLTAYYALHSIVLVTLGLVKSLRGARLLGLALFAGTLIKTIVVDLGFLDTIYRVLSFLALGALLVAASFLYQRFRERLEPPERSS